MYRLVALFALLFPATVFAHPEDGSQFTPLDQVTPANVDQLALAFSFSNGDLSQGFQHKGHTFQAVPVYWAGRLYISTSSNLVFSIDAGTGEEVWRFNPELERNIGYSESASRGVALWHGESATCPDRIFHGTLNGELIALNAVTGEPCTDFGTEGRIDLGIGIRNRRLGDYSVTSPVAVLPDRIIVGSAVGDNGAVDLEQGVVRALDPVSGDLLWLWDPIPRSPKDPAAATWQGNSATITGAANAWAPISVDPERGLVFVPTSSPSPDFYGGERLGENHYANSIVVLDAATGEVRWFRQLVHHDLWDYDTPSEPSLTTIQRGGEKIPAVVVTTKTGMIFAFSRETGESIYDITEKPVPASDVAGEEASPTQPFSEIVLTRHDPITEDDAFGLLWFDRNECREKIRSYRSEGIFTPPAIRGTIESPGWAGGMNWGGAALDESRQIAIVNYMNLAGVIQLLPRQAFEEAVSTGSMRGWQLTAMAGTPYGMARRFLVSSLGIPCVKPPWGEIAAVDLTTGDIIWKKPFGTIQDLSPVPLPGFLARALVGDWGAPTIGGPLATSTGLIFIGATSDFYFRALDTTTGEELWRYRLETSAAAIPASYMHNGRQHVVIAVGGHAEMPRGDKLLVFAIPE